MKLSRPAAREPEPGIERVSNIELFLDLVFVFAVTQLTKLVMHADSWEGYAHVLLAFASLIWIYDGFAWLTTNMVVRSDRDYWLMSAAMAAFLLISLSIPTVFGTGGLTFGLGLMLAASVHGFLFRTTGNSSAEAIVRIIPFNVGSAALITGAAFVPWPWKWYVWIFAVALPFFNPFTRVKKDFKVSPKHFVERHGLLILIALGESIVGVGEGAAEQKLTLVDAGYAVFALYVALCIWASYFDEDDKRAEQALDSATDERRAEMALYGFGYAHFTMIMGVILAAAGLEAGIKNPLAMARPLAACNLGFGLALYLVGDVLYRRILSIGPSRVRVTVAVLAIATSPIGIFVNGLAQLGACVVILTGLWAIKSA